MRQQLARMPGVFAGDEIAFIEDPQRSKGNIFKIADRSCYDVQSA